MKLGLFTILLSLVGCSTTFHKEIIFKNPGDFEKLESQFQKNSIVLFPLTDRGSVVVSKKPEFCLSQSGQGAALFINWSGADRTAAQKQKDLDKWLQSFVSGTSSVSYEIKNYGETAELESARSSCFNLSQFYWPEI